jgi:predicted DNA-binding transcriptional regulator AlpA
MDAAWRQPTCRNVGKSPMNDVSEAAPPATLLKPATVAKRLEIGQRTLWRWVSTGEFPPPDFRRGAKIVRWRADTVATWIDANTTGGRQ